MAPMWGATREHRRATLIVAAGLTVALISAVAMITLPLTGATFTNTAPAAANIGAAHIFRGTRDTVAFSVTDVSSGSSSDGSNSYAFASDGRYFTSYALGSSFDISRYVEFDLNAPLPAGLAASSVQLGLRFSGNAGGASTCVYVELRQASTGSLISTHGSSGSPLACSSGTTFTSASPSLGSVSTTDMANDLRVRVYASDSTAGALRVDAVTVSGSTPYASFTLYPILSRDHHNGQNDLIRWGLAGS